MNLSVILLQIHLMLKKPALLIEYTDRLELDLRIWFIIAVGSTHENLSENLRVNEPVYYS